MSKLAAAQALAAQAAATGVDMTQAVKGGGGRLLPAGYSIARLVEYVEFGKQPQEFQGKAKEPCMEIQIAFALYGPGYANDDGTPYILRPYRMALQRNEKSRAFKLFNKMNWQGDKTHYAQLVGGAYVVKIVHEPKSKTDSTTVSRIDLEGILPPVDPLSQQPYQVPPARDEDIRLFLWDHPSIEAWAELYVDGKYDDGKSKNVVQETIMGATDFHGSPLYHLLSAQGVPMSLPEPAAAPVAPSALPPGAGYAPAFSAPPAAPAVAPTAPVAPAAAPVVAAPAPLAPAPVAPAIAAVPTFQPPPAIAVPPVSPSATPAG